MNDNLYNLKIQVKSISISKDVFQKQDNNTFVSVNVCINDMNEISTEKIKVQVEKEIVISIDPNIEHILIQNVNMRDDILKVYVTIFNNKTTQQLKSISKYLNDIDTTNQTEVEYLSCQYKIILNLLPSCNDFTIPKIKLFESNENKKTIIKIKENSIKSQRDKKSSLLSPDFIAKQDKFKDTKSEHNHQSSHHNCLDNSINDISDNDSNYPCFLTSNGEEFLTDNIDSFSFSNIIYPEKIFYDSEYEKKTGENFCEAFFLSGMKFDNPLVIQNSEKYLSTCGHEHCSFLPAFQAEIIVKYPPKPAKNFELNESFASFCFPNGVKICYEQDENKITPIENFCSLLTNINGERQYIMNYFYYKKIDYLKFHKEYEKADPIKSFLKNTHIDEDLTEEERAIKEEEMDTKIEKCMQFINNDSIYIPYCISLISCYPLSKTLEKCLKGLLIHLSNKELNEEVIIGILNYLIYEVPIPKNDFSFMFYIPYFTCSLTVCNLVDKNLPTVNYKPSLLFSFFSVENIILIHYLMLMEKKILFITENGHYNYLTQITEALNCLLYPLTWVHTYIPVIPYDMLKFLQSFLPFMVGIDQSIRSTADLYLESEVFLVFIKNNSVLLSGSDNKKEVNLNSFDAKFPSENEKFLYSELTNLKKMWLEKKKTKLSKHLGNHNDQIRLDDINYQLREIFGKSMAILFEDYRKHTFFINGAPHLNENNFISDRGDANKLFYIEFLNTQNFRQFLQVSVQQKQEKYFAFFEKCCGDFRETYGLKSSTSGLNRGNLNTNLLSLKNNVFEFRSHNMKKSRSSRENLPNFSLEYNNSMPQLKKKLLSKDFDFSPIIDKESNIYILAPYFIYEQKDLASKEAIENYISHKQLEKYQNHIIDEKLINIPILCDLTKKVPYELNKYFIAPLFDDFSVDLQNNLSTEEYSSNNNIINQMNDIKSKRNTIIYSSNCNSPGKKQMFKRKQSIITTILHCSTMKDLENFEDQISEIISDHMHNLLTLSSKSNKENISDIAIILTSRLARSKFATIVFQDNFIQNSKHLLDENSFNEMKQIIFHTLLSCQTQAIEYEDARLITKSLFHYYKITKEKNKNISVYLYKELASIKGSFRIWLDAEFWKYFVETEIEENSLSKGQNFNNVDAYNFFIITKVANIMVDLNIEFAFILETLYEKTAKNFIQKDFLLKDLLASLKKLKKK